ncbi:MAG: hypothetical protein AAFR38_08910 [Planctomycetota bacterium]
MKNMSVLALAAFAGAASGQNLLSNAGFEMALNYDGNSVGNWNAFFGGADFQQAEVVDPLGSSPAAAPTEGALALQIGTFNTSDTFVGVVQNVGGIAAGTEYTFSFDARQVVQNGAFVEFRIEWLDSGGNFVGGQFDLNTGITGSLTDAFQGFSLSAVAPVGAVAANAVIAAQTFGSNAPFEGFFQFDNASFIPAPGAAAAFGLVGLAATRRRR